MTSKQSLKHRIAAPMSLAIASYLKRAAGPLLKSPLSDGAAGEALITDGAGNLSFAAPLPAEHDHDGDYDALGTAVATVAAHAAAGDPHPQYLTAAEGNAAYDVAGAAAAAQAASQPLDAQLSSLAGLAYSGNANKVIRVNAGENAFELATPAAGGSAAIDINTQTSGYTLQSSDLGDLIDFTTAGVTLTLPAAATAGDTFYCWVKHSGAASAILTIDGDGAETIDGAATIFLNAGELRLLICNGTSWRTEIIEQPIRGVFTKPVVGDFAWINQGSATIAATRNGLVLTKPAGGGSHNVSLLKKSAPATPYTITACFQAAWDTTGAAVSDTSNYGLGLVWRQSSDGKLVTCGVLQTNKSSATAPPSGWGAIKWNSATSLSAVYSGYQSAWQPFGGPLWVRITDDGTNRKMFLSVNGEDWVECGTNMPAGRTDFLTADEVGFFVHSYNTKLVVTLLSWKET